MATSAARPDIAPCVNAEQFEAMKGRFRDVGDCLTDEQLLELADCYHEILRWRRDVRMRQAARAPRSRTCHEPSSFRAGDARTSIWDEAREVIAAGPAAFPPCT